MGIFNDFTRLNTVTGTVEFLKDPIDNTVDAVKSAVDAVSHPVVTAEKAINAVNASAESYETTLDLYRMQQDEGAAEEYKASIAGQLLGGGAAGVAIKKGVDATIDAVQASNAAKIAEVAKQERIVENNVNADNDLLSPDLNRADFRWQPSQIGNAQVLESIMRRGDVELKQGISVDQVFRDVIQKPIGERPDPSTYLSQSYIDNHLSKFDDGATKFMLSSNYNRFGIGQTDGTSFILPKDQADILMKQTGGDPVKLADALGIPRNQLNNDSLVKIDILNPKNSGLRLPSGNEAGANSQWIPGGKLPNGNYEAIIDANKIKPSQIIVNPIR
ncbi:hypothetical protein [Acinetobacter populi]|uniref:Uncharacterized protein n=1 Tax=Acinetobacter populi TaxID=1582270 RepID=A0A1Z9YUH7_9GAMM|nr:hypothetical protein [Acinetobacter populi]OUY05876.1 hypothetical protein CAP51_14235 [Acinetobacter populi]